MVLKHTLKMEYQLQSDEVKVVVRSKGAELVSIVNRKNGLEYLWQADPAYWNRHAPVLFPIVGRLKGDKYMYQDKAYTMSQHGFARDLEFAVDQPDDNALLFRLENQEETYRKYPFNFCLDIAYSLKASTISVQYKVRNTDSKDIFMSIGAHPAFNCPLQEGESFEDYSLYFSEAESSQRHLLSDGLFTGKTEAIPMEKEKNELPLSYDLFEKDAIVLKNIESDAVTLQSRKSRHGVAMSFPDFPYLGIWTKRRGAPFICIEPWCGLADNENTSGDIREKEGINKLEPGTEFYREYKIQIF